MVIYIIGGFIFVSFIVLLIFIYKKYKSRFSWLMFLLALFLLISAVFLGLEASVKIHTGWQHHNWPVVNGTVTGGYISGIRAFQPEISYQYEILGKVYTGQTDLNTPGFGNRRYRRDTAEQILADYPAGSMVRIHYDPVHPEISLIRPGPFYSDYMQLSLGTVCFILGIFILFRIVKIRRRW